MTSLSHGDDAAAELSAGTMVGLAVLAGVVMAYLVMAARRRRDPSGWRMWRIASFVGGVIALSVAAFVPWFDSSGGFPAHVMQHVLIGMYAPLGIVLGAPITLLLRSLPRSGGRRLVRVLRSPVAALLGHPAAIMAMSLGGLVALYCTPVYEATLASPFLHAAIHLHFLLSGLLFAWVIAGPDPGPHRPSIPVRLVWVGVAIASHATIAQLMYAGVLTGLPEPLTDIRTGAELMYYTGDIAHLLLALSLLTTRPNNPRRVRIRPHVRWSGLLSRVHRRWQVPGNAPVRPGEAPASAPNRRIDPAILEGHTLNRGLGLLTLAPCDTMNHDRRVPARPSGR
jgi:putative membrane protein